MRQSICRYKGGFGQGAAQWEAERRGTADMRVSVHVRILAHSFAWGQGAVGASPGRDQGDRCGRFPADWGDPSAATASRSGGRAPPTSAIASAYLTVGSSSVLEVTDLQAPSVLPSRTPRL